MIRVLLMLILIMHLCLFSAYPRMGAAGRGTATSPHPKGTYHKNTADQAKLITDYEIHDRAETELPDKDALIWVYRRNGHRSGNAAKEMLGLGYANVIDFAAKQKSMIPFPGQRTSRVAQRLTIYGDQNDFCEKHRKNTRLSDHRGRRRRQAL